MRNSVVGLMKQSAFDNYDVITENRDLQVIRCRLRKMYRHLCDVSVVFRRESAEIR